MNEETKPAAEPKPEYATKRRSERLFLTLPIRVNGTDPKGRDFSEECVSINVSRHGARIRLNNALTVDDVIHITNLKNNQDASFRVVGRVSEPHPELSYSDWGVETLDPSINIWGVELRENPLDETAFSAVLQCSSCQVMSSFLLTHKEVGATGASSYITRDCPRCARETLWTFVSSDRRQPPMPTEKPLEAAVRADRLEQERRAQERRKEHRFSVRVPVRIRTPEGEKELSTTVNLSRKGSLFEAARNYAVGTIVYIAAPYKQGEEPLELKATVEHVEDLPGSPKKLYGVKFLF